MTSVMKLANSFRQWQKEWEMYDNNISTKKPKSFDEFVKPFVKMHKQEMEKCYEHGSFALLDTGHGDTFEQYYQETFKK